MNFFVFICFFILNTTIQANEYFCESPKIKRFVYSLDSNIQDPKYAQQGDVLKHNISIQKKVMQDRVNDALIQESEGPFKLSAALIQKHNPGLDVLKRYQRQTAVNATCCGKLLLCWQKIWDQPLTEAEFESAKKYMNYVKYGAIASHDYSQYSNSILSSEERSADYYSFIP